MTHDPLSAETDTKTSHDPLCPSVTACDCKHAECCFCDSEVWCMCSLIAKVRADEQWQVASRLTAYHGEGCIGATGNLGCGCGLWNDVMTYSVEMP